MKKDKFKICKSKFSYILFEKFIQGDPFVCPQEVSTTQRGGPASRVVSGSGKEPSSPFSTSPLPRNNNPVRWVGLREREIPKPFLELVWLAAGGLSPSSNH